MTRTTFEIEKSDWHDKACDICGGRKFSELGKRVYEVPGRSKTFEMRFHDAVCEQCGFVLETLVPDVAFLDAYYQDAHIRLSEYAAIAPDYDIDARLELIRRHIPAGSSVLEVGASDGRFIERLRESGYPATGIDPVNTEIMERNILRLRRVATESGRLKIVRIPAPRRETDFFGGTYTNIVLANGVLLFPIWENTNSETEKLAMDVYHKLLPNWKIVGIESKDLGLSHGGLRCATLPLRIPPDINDGS